MKKLNRMNKKNEFDYYLVDLRDITHEAQKTGRIAIGFYREDEETDCTVLDEVWIKRSMVTICEWRHDREYLYRADGQYIGAFSRYHPRKRPRVSPEQDLVARVFVPREYKVKVRASRIDYEETMELSKFLEKNGAKTFEYPKKKEAA